MTLYEKYGMTGREYDAIKKLLCREPNETELLLFSVMWSEHCSYKTSRPYLKMFPVKGKAVIQGPGENAGVIEAFPGVALAFKIESHNHPSAVEPVQGAATGVGGIIRDILAMGARPIASLDGLCFGNGDDARTKYLSNGIVAGISGYGNAVGVPTIGGKTIYHPWYEDNPLVNAMTIGVVKPEEMATSRGAKPGDAVVLLGSRTGRDGIAGAAFASVELDDKSKESRPQVQIGDPFMEKLLIEACLEIHKTGVISSMQDMGAAGITSSSSEIAAKSGVGIEIDVDLVPLREKGMTPWEVLLSESQERMLIITDPSNVADIEKTAKKWDLECALIGRIIEGNNFRVVLGGEIVADVPADSLGGGCPIVERSYARPSDMEERQKSFYPAEMAPHEALLALFADKSMGDRSWIYEQYDHMIQTNTVELPGSDVSVIRIKETQGFVAVSLESAPMLCWLDPYTGGGVSVLRAARSLYSCGADPLGMTNCLNYPSPEKPGQMWEFIESLKGMADVCRALSIPVVGGNVSLYNETPRNRILPTPMIGIVGRIENRKFYIPNGFVKDGDIVALVGKSRPSWAGSRYISVMSGVMSGKPSEIDFDHEKLFAEKMLGSTTSGALRSSRAVASGGLGVAIARESMAKGMGFIADESFRPTMLELFGEGGACAVISFGHDCFEALKEIWKEEIIIIGKTGGDSISLSGTCAIKISNIVELWKNGGRR